MGVDYYQCASCNFGFRDDSDYCAYCECGNHFCSKECGKLTNYSVMEEPDEAEGEEKYQLYLDGNTRIDLEQPITCVICRNESYTEYTLLEAVLKHFRITREQAINIWRSSKKP
jgi:hypothetical protein